VPPVLRDALRRLSHNKAGLWLWVPAFAGTTVLDTRPHVPAARCARVVHVSFAHEGVGNAGWQAHPQPRVEKITRELVTTVAPVHPAFPHANGFNGFLRALLGDRALLPPSPAGVPPTLDASVGASGPHDFAVRLRPISSAPPKRPPHPAPNVLSRSRNAPLIGCGTRGNVPVICPTSQAKLPATRWHDGQITCRVLISVKGITIDARSWNK
jgi:hypothetical protein